VNGILFVRSGGYRTITIYGWDGSQDFSLVPGIDRCWVDEDDRDNRDDSHVAAWYGDDYGPLSSGFYAEIQDPLGRCVAPAFEALRDAAQAEMVE
jgi:hypothetical protein